VETGIGYNNAKHDFRIYESYAVLHTDIQRSEKQPPNYWFVAPNYYNLAEWGAFQAARKVQDKQASESQGAGDTVRPKIGFFGRIGNLKGCHVIAEVAKRFPQVDFILCGQGDPAPYVCENVIYKPPIHGHERASYLSSLTALIAPSSFMEPFCGANVEAQLCGTPVIGPEHGAFTETVEPFKTGLLCHTLQDYCRGVQMALDGKFDREYVARRAASRYDMFVVARRYEYIFRSILDIYNGNDGWYSPNSYVDVLE
jgi:glycosyltransferase involved in cell wall biosynthesis